MLLAHLPSLPRGTPTGLPAQHRLDRSGTSSMPPAPLCSNTPTYFFLFLADHRSLGGTKSALCCGCVGGETTVVSSAHTLWDFYTSAVSTRLMELRPPIHLPSVHPFTHPSVHPSLHPLSIHPTIKYLLSARTLPGAVNKEKNET